MYEKGEFDIQDRAKCKNTPLFYFRKEISTHFAIITLDLRSPSIHFGILLSIFVKSRWIHMFYSFINMMMYLTNSYLREKKMFQFKPKYCFNILELILKSKKNPMP